MATGPLCGFILLLLYIAWYAWFLSRTVRSRGYHPAASASIAPGVWVYDHGWFGLGKRRVYQLDARDLALRSK